MDFTMNLLGPGSYNSPYNSGHEEDTWRCAWCNKEFNEEWVKDTADYIIKDNKGNIDIKIAQWDKIIGEFIESTVEQALKFTNWCSGCNQLSGQCCTSSENGCAFDDYYAKFICAIEVNGIKIPGSPIIPISKAKEFIEMLTNDTIKLETWCACPGFCPHSSVCEYSKRIPWRDEWCCKYNKIKTDSGWRRVHKDYHTEITKGKTRHELADWAKSNLLKWPHSDNLKTADDSSIQ